jgi:hypothetical protein
MGKRVVYLKDEAGKVVLDVAGKPIPDADKDPEAYTGYLWGVPLVEENRDYRRKAVLDGMKA